MRSRPLNTCLICMCFLIYSSALPRAKDYRPVSSEYASSAGTDVGSSNSGSVGSYSKEPSCEELRAMWRFSKRQSRAAEITNEIPTYRDPFAFNVWEDYAARPRSAGRGFHRYRKPPVYGKIVHGASYPRTPEHFPNGRIHAIEEVAHLFGTPQQPASTRRKTSFRFGGGGTPISHLQMHPSQTGRSFQHLKELIRSERARELQEQRLSEQADRNLIKEVPYGRLEDTSPLNIDNTLPNDRTATAQNKGIVAFPDILVPASYKYMDDYIYPASQLTLHKYKQRYPDTNSIMDGQGQWAW